MEDEVPTVESAFAKGFCRSYLYQVLRFGDLSVDIEKVQSLLHDIESNYTMVSKDSYRGYEGVGMQYSDDTNPFYDGMQYYDFSTIENPKKFDKLNEIGKMFKFVYDTFANLGLPLERGRVLKAKPGHVHAPHTDGDMRIHLPLSTNSECRMVYLDKEPPEDKDREVDEGRSYHMPADGHFYLINSHKWHYFYNKGDTDRVHIVWRIQKEGIY